MTRSRSPRRGRATRGFGFVSPEEIDNAEAFFGELLGHSARSPWVGRPTFTEDYQAPWSETPPRTTTRTFERITTFVPWPRGIAYHDDKLYVLARGRIRSTGTAGGPMVGDQAGTLFEVNPAIAEPVTGTPPYTAGPAVIANGRVAATPTAPPFKLWRGPPAIDDIDTDRPYATLVWDSASRNYFICGFSGIDRPSGLAFRKNATDSILRYDTRDRRWHVVESHDPARPGSGGLAAMTATARRSASLGAIDGRYYPHAGSTTAPRGWVNGPDGLLVHGDGLYAVGKDNHILVRYDLSGIRASASAGPPTGTRLVQGKSVANNRGIADIFDGPSALAVHGRHLYVGLRTNNYIVRFQIRRNGTLTASPPTAEVVGRLPTVGGYQVIDLAFNRRGELFVSAKNRAVFNMGRPSARTPWGLSGAAPTPYHTFPANISNIVFDDQDRLYVCCNSNDDPATPDKVGVVYRVS